MKRFLIQVDLFLIEFYTDVKCLFALVALQIVLFIGVSLGAEFFGASLDCFAAFFWLANGRRYNKGLPHWVALACCCLAGLAQFNGKIPSGLPQERS